MAMKWGESMPREIDYVPIDVADYIRSTDLACLFEIDGEEIWVPKSVIDWDSSDFGEDDEGMDGTVYIAEWFCDKEGIVY